jgi:hypothetical protein
LSTDSTLPPDGNDPNSPPGGNGNDGTRFLDQPIEDELKESYLTYAMSVIVSRALPDVRDGLKPSQRRILVAMDDLNLGPTAARVNARRSAAIPAATITRTASRSSIPRWCAWPRNGTCATC